jgi:hypothetical protein
MAYYGVDGTLCFGGTMKRYPLVAAIIAAGLLVAAPVGAQPKHDHHHHHGHAAPKADLDNGKRWETDAPLREGMKQIRAIMAADHPKVHKGQWSADDAAALGKRVDAEVKKIFAACKLRPEADAVLHQVLAHIMDGSKVAQSDTDRSAGFHRIMHGLDEYGRLFDHPGWKPLKH